MENSYLWMGDNPPNPLTGGNPQTPVGQMGKECLYLINWLNIDSSYYGGGIIERQTLEALANRREAPHYKRGGFIEP